MRRTRPPYSPEFRRQMVDLVHACRDPADLAREFEPSAESIRAWVALAARKEGGREEKAKVVDLSATERDELGRLRRENECEPGHFPDCYDGACAGCLRSWLPCLAQASTKQEARG